jgi:hypothetical protein
MQTLAREIFLHGYMLVEQQIRTAGFSILGEKVTGTFATWAGAKPLHRTPAKIHYLTICRKRTKHTTHSSGDE